MSPKIDLVAQSEKAQLKGDAFLTEGQTQNALAEYSRAIELNPNSAPCFFKRALAYHFLDMYGQCIIDSEKVRELDPKYEKVYGLLGIAYAHLGRLLQAHQAFAQALMFEPNNIIYRGSFQLIDQKLYQTELEKARFHEFCYFINRYEQFRKDPDVLAAALLLLKEPSACNITSIMLLNKQVKQQSNVINTLQYLQEHSTGIVISVYKIKIKHQIEKYGMEEETFFTGKEREDCKYSTEDMYIT